MRDSAQLAIPTGAQAVQYPDHYKLARTFGRHLASCFSGLATGNGAANIGLVTQRAADIPAEGSVDIVSSNAADTTQSLTIYGVLNGAPVSEVLALNGTTPVVGAQDFDTVLGVRMSGVALGTVIVRDTAIPTTIFSLATTVLTRGVFAPNLTVGATAVVSVDVDVAEDVLVVGRNAADAVIMEVVDLTAAATTPVELTEAFVVIDYVMLGDVAAARTVSISGGASKLLGVPFEPSLVDAIRVGAAQRRLPGPVHVNLLTGALITGEITIAAGANGWDVTLPRALALPGVDVYVQCWGHANIGGST